MTDLHCRKCEKGVIIYNNIRYIIDKRCRPIRVANSQSGHKIIIHILGEKHEIVVNFNLRRDF